MRITAALIAVFLLATSLAVWFEGKALPYGTYRCHVPIPVDPSETGFERRPFDTFVVSSGERFSHYLRENLTTSQFEEAIARYWAEEWEQFPVQGCSVNHEIGDLRLLRWRKEGWGRFHFILPEFHHGASLVDAVIDFRSLTGEYNGATFSFQRVHLPLRCERDRSSDLDLCLTTLRRVLE